MLHFEPAHLLSGSFLLRRGAREETELELGGVARDTGRFEHDGVTYELGRAGLASGDFTLKSDGRRLAGAVKPSPLRRRFVVSCPEGTYTLQARHPFLRPFDVIEGREVIGSIEPDRLFGERGRAKLPTKLPFETSVFMLWLVLTVWRSARRDTL